MVANYPDLVKEFVVYTLLRLVMFAASVRHHGRHLAGGLGQVPVMWVFIIAFVVSGMASYVVLDPQRERFARRVDERARRATAAFEANKAREDAD